MRLATFLPSQHSQAGPRLGTLLTDGNTIADLHAGFKAMAGSTSRFLNDMLSLRR